MPGRITLFIFFVIGVVGGGSQVYRLIMASRKAAHSPGALREWLAMPLPSWRYEPDAILAILIHTLCVLVLGLLALRATSNQGLFNQPLFVNDSTMIALIWFAESGSILLTGYYLGSLLVSFPLILFRRQPVSVAVTQQGMVFGQNFLPWRWFSHFSIDNGLGILRLFSPFSQDLPSLTLKLPRDRSWAEINDSIALFLPSRPPEGSRAWYQTKSFLIPAMLLICLPIVFAGWFASSLSRELSLFVVALLASILFSLGGLVLNLFAFGVIKRKANS